MGTKNTVSGAAQFLIQFNDELKNAQTIKESSGKKKPTSLFSDMPTKLTNTQPNHWVPPPSGVVKMNCDTSFIKETREAWGGAVTRDCRGRVYASMDRHLPQCSSLEEAEAAIVLICLTELSKLYRGHLNLEVDCARLGRELQTTGRCRSANERTCGAPMCGFGN